MMAWLMGLKTIAPRDLLPLVQSGRVTTFDVNSHQRWTQTHVPGALHIDPAFDARALPTDKSAPLVFYCGNPLCRKAPNAARRAKQLGYADVRVMSAGIAGWLDAGLPTETGR